MGTTQQRAALGKYFPCRYGIHICGINSDETEFVTVANFPRASRAVFESLKADFAIDDEPDLVVDFFVDGDCDHDFGIRRQSLAAIEAAILAAN